MNEDNHPQKQVRPPHLPDDRTSSDSELSSLSFSRDTTGSLRDIGAIEDPFSPDAVTLTSENRPMTKPKDDIASSHPHDIQFCINMAPVRDLGPAVEFDDSDASLLPLMKYTEGNNFDLRGISDFLSSFPSPGPELQCAALQLIEHAAEWQNPNFTDNMSVTFGPVAKLLLDSQDNLVHCAALDTLKFFLASPCATDIVKSMIPRCIVDVVSNDLNSSDPLVQLASVELLNAATRSEEILVEFAAAVSLISIALPSMPAATQVSALRVLEVSAGSRTHELIKAVAETFHYLYRHLSSPEPTVQIAVLEVLEAAARTKDPDLARIFKATLPAVKKIQSSGETGLHSAAKKVLETAAHNDQLTDAVKAISPDLLRQPSDKPGVQIPAVYGKSQALRPAGQAILSY